MVVVSARGCKEEERALTVCFKELWRSAVLLRHFDDDALWLRHFMSFTPTESMALSSPQQYNRVSGFTRYMQHYGVAYKTFSSSCEVDEAASSAM